MMASGKKRPKRNTNVCCCSHFAAKNGAALRPNVTNPMMAMALMT
jgi:hypothetical protein